MAGGAKERRQVHGQMKERANGVATKPKEKEPQGKLREAIEPNRSARRLPGLGQVRDALQNTTPLLPPWSLGQLSIKNCLFQSMPFLIIKLITKRNKEVVLCLVQINIHTYIYQI